MAKMGTNNNNGKARFTRLEQRYYAIRFYFQNDTTVEADMIAAAKSRGVPIVGSFKQCISAALDEYNKCVERDNTEAIEFYTAKGCDPRVEAELFDRTEIAKQNTRPATLPPI